MGSHSTLLKERHTWKEIARELATALVYIQEKALITEYDFQFGGDLIESCGRLRELGFSEELDKKRPTVRPCKEQFPVDRK